APITCPTWISSQSSASGTATSATNSTHNGMRRPGLMPPSCVTAPNEPPKLGPALGDAPDGDPAQRLGGDVRTHLGVAPLALDELDRDLHHLHAPRDGPEGHVGLE